jgi:hypothetical protein
VEAPTSQTTSATVTPSATLSPTLPTANPSKPPLAASFLREYWPYFLGALIAEILIVTAAGFYLYRKGLLRFPLLKKKKSD